MEVTTVQQAALRIIGKTTLPQHLWRKRVEINTRRSVVNRGWVVRDIASGDLRLTSNGVKAAELEE